MAGTKPLIFVVDDDRGMLRLIEKTLQREGFDTATASSAPAALEWLLAGRPALMLLDLNLGGVQGKEVINHLESTGNLVPFVVITGQGDERVAVEMMKRGALDYLVKDAQFQEFIPTVVQRALNQVEREEKLALAEEAARRENEFAGAVLDASGALMAVLDRDGRIVRFNKACERLTGFPAGNVKGRAAWEVLVPREERAKMQHSFAQLAAGQEAVTSELRCLTRGGERPLIAWSSTAMRNPDGSLHYVIASGIDITEHRRLENEVLRISEMEQRRIGQDLHDGICQNLAGIELMTQALEQHLEKTSKANAARAGQIAAQVRESIRQTKQLAHGLSPIALDENGLMSALHELAANVSSMFRVNCTFRCDEPVLVRDTAAATHLFRIAQEAVSNAIRHGHARHVEVVLQQRPQRIVLLVNDDGAGFVKPPEDHRGMGLRIMEHRAGIIHASLAIQPRPEGGTTVVCSLGEPEDKLKS